jgi:hypothetical protein
MDSPLTRMKLKLYRYEPNKFEVRLFEWFVTKLFGADLHSRQIMCYLSSLPEMFDTTSKACQICPKNTSTKDEKKINVFLSECSDQYWPGRGDAALNKDKLSTVQSCLIKRLYCSGRSQGEVTFRAIQHHRRDKSCHGFGPPHNCARPPSR